ncbi:sugar-binding protein [Geochorda subterranea]|uniref:Sugar-binding protein n=1 Tax=Geochorda subterranea TaxID=3109564 RepID=A0ABZ1BPF6_9FIRM|nr:sugar-binding protein [Limnochorda sp. LNt]WRP14353.1 sugar-binding protein [Limnochorda sp. LNt]
MRRVGVGLLVAAMLLAAVGVVSAAEPIRIGVLGKSVHPYWDVVRNGTMAAAALFPDVEVTFFVPQTEDIGRQIDVMESWIAQGFDGISVAPSDPAALAPVIRRALEAGIHVITNDTDAPGTGRLLYLGTGNYNAGFAAGKAMAELLGGSGEVAILTGSLTALNSLERIQGFRDALRGTGIRIVEPVLNDNEDTFRATDLATTAILNNPGLRGIFGVYAASTTGAAEAVRSTRTQDRVVVVGFDTLDSHLEALENGYLDAVVGQKQYFMGYNSVVLLYLMAKTGRDNVLSLLPRTEDGDIFVDTGVDVVTRDNLHAYVQELDRLGIPHAFVPSR